MSSKSDGLGKTRFGKWYWHSGKVMWFIAALDLALWVPIFAWLVLAEDAPIPAAITLASYAVAIVNICIAIYNLEAAS